MAAVVGSSSTRSVDHGTDPCVNQLDHFIASESSTSLDHFPRGTNSLSETFGSAGAWAHARTPRNLVTRKREEPVIRQRGELLVAFPFQPAVVLLRSIRQHLDERTTLRPFPLEPALWTRYREEMIANTGFTIFLAGNKLKGSQIVSADGCHEEFEITRRLGKYPIPIGATGSAAREIWEKVVASLDTLFPGKANVVAPQFNVLGDTSATDDTWLTALFAIVDTVGGR